MAATSQPEQALYLYCFTWPGRDAPAVPGVDERRPVALHQHGGVAAVIGQVDLAEFTGDTGEDNLQDIAWLGPRACRHAAVVEHAMAAGPVYPLPFGTLFSGPAALEQEIDRLADDIAAVLRQVEGCEEWSVEGMLDRKQAVDARLAEGLQSGELSLPAAAGRRHLEEQKLRRALTADLDDWLDQHTDTLRQTLAALSRDQRPRRLRDEIVLHWAYLIPRANIEAFGDSVRAFADRHEAYGLGLRLTGPWPPYSFCHPPA